MTPRLGGGRQAVVRVLRLLVSQVEVVVVDGVVAAVAVDVRGSLAPRVHLESGVQFGFRLLSDVRVELWLTSVFCLPSPISHISSGISTLPRPIAVPASPSVHRPSVHSPSSLRDLPFSARRRPRRGDLCWRL